MRTPKLFVTGLALAALSGCGATTAGQNPSARAGTTPSTPASASAPAPATSPSARPSTPATAKPTRPKPTAVPVKGKPKRTKHRGGQRRHGPAESLLKTGGAGVALTFDDGPDPVQTPRMLDLLKKQHVKATFCVVGQQAARYPGLIRRIAAEGHTLCNHTWRHSLTLGKKKPAVIRADLERTNKAIRAAVPGAKIKYMRAPGGNFTGRFVAVATDLGMKSIYWQVDPRDWEHRGGKSGAAHQKKIIHSVQRHVGKGAIVLSHDYGQPDTIAAYRRLIPWLKGRYKLIALPQ